MKKFTLIFVSCYLVFSSMHRVMCVTQCFFNELNLVDQRGFPERSAVIGIMTQNIQDPELRDFVEESVIECYHYINNNNSGRQEKCQFSQSLLSCLAEKGSERCEDWDDE
uniref:Putative odorant binding protein 64 n=1 Tax=Nasonia vitripennis TaxID=7425 RepID=G8B1R9_NASVI|nr:putative odorant binding protein 64 [Nasonia vitripennis]